MQFSIYLYQCTWKLNYFASEACGYEKTYLSYCLNGIKRHQTISSKFSHMNLFCLLYDFSFMYDLSVKFPVGLDV